MRTRRIDVGEVTLEVAEAGEGGRPFLLVHGFGAAKEDFVPYLDLLAALGWHAVSPDLRGHGSSDQPDDEGAYSLKTFASDLVALVDALGWSRFTLLGHSMGGMVVQVLALDHADRLDALILMDTSHGVPPGVDPAIVDLGQQVVREGGMPLLVEVTKQIEDPLSSPAHRRLVETRPGYGLWSDGKTLGASPAMWLTMSGQLITQEDRIDQLAHLDLPVLVIVGELDGPFLVHSEAMGKAIPGATYAVIPDAGHSPQFESPDAWWLTLTAFLAELA
jgi:2-succinyl-6-hydroxy-2,4-cyclohexadiene-1-carboxylate synthase